MLRFVCTVSLVGWVTLFKWISSFSTVTLLSQLTPLNIALAKLPFENMHIRFDHLVDWVSRKNLVTFKDFSTKLNDFFSLSHFHFLFLAISVYGMQKKNGATQLKKTFLVLLSICPEDQWPTAVDWRQSEWLRLAQCPLGSMSTFVMALDKPCDDLGI